MSDPEREQQDKVGKVDTVTVLYILGGIPAIVAYIVILFALVSRFPSVPG